MQLNEENCYETIPGVANLSSALCPPLPPDSGAHLLNLFSTVDHSSYCLAHVWTYRSLVSTLDIVLLTGHFTDGWRCSGSRTPPRTGRQACQDSALCTIQR